MMRGAEKNEALSMKDIIGFKSRAKIELRQPMP